MINSRQSLLVLCALTMVNGKIFCAADRQPDSKKLAKEKYGLFYSITSDGWLNYIGSNARYSEKPDFLKKNMTTTTSLVAPEKKDREVLILRREKSRYREATMQEYLCLGDVKVQRGQKISIFVVNHEENKVHWLGLKKACKLIGKTMSDDEEKQYENFLLLQALVFSDVAEAIGR